VVSKTNYLTEIKELVAAYGVEKIASLLESTTRGVGYWIAEKGKKVPHRDTQKKIHELFRKHTSGEPLEAHNGHDPNYREKYIESLERENKRLERDLAASLGEMAERQLYALSISQTNQQLLIELLAKQRRVPVPDLSKEVGKENYDRLQKLKAGGRLNYADRYNTAWFVFISLSKFSKSMLR